MHDPLDEERLGKELVREGLLSDNQLRTSKEYQVSLGGKLTDIILKLGFVPEKILNRAIARREHMQAIDLTGRVVDRELMARIPRKIIERHEAIPLRADDETILLAMSESTDYQAIEDFQFLTSSRIESVLAPRSQILELMTRYYAEQDAQAGVSEPSLADRMLERVADPAVAALARVLLERGVISAEDWSAALGEKKT